MSTAMLHPDMGIRYARDSQDAEAHPALAHTTCSKALLQSSRSRWGSDPCKRATLPGRTECQHRDYRLYTLMVSRT